MFRRFLLSTLCLALAGAGCSRSGPPPEREARPVPVLTATVESRDTPLVIPAIGQVQPYATVSIKPQVTGQIAEVHFSEGQQVKEGDLLYTIDKRPFKVALHQAQAALEQAQAAFNNAERQAKRYNELSKRGAVAAEQFDQIQLTRETTAASMKAAEAALRYAELNLEYCAIRAPISGRTGGRLVDQGNVVTANVTDLLVINQFNPIYVSCTVAERYLGEINHFIATPEGIVARARPEGKEAAVVEGPVTFVDNNVKSGSGTLQLKATFDNAKNELWPGQFTAVELVLTVEKGAIIVPGNAIATGRKGPYAFVVRDDHTVEARDVALSRRIGDEAVVARGLKAGEVIVVDGHNQLVPGSRIEIRPGLDVAESAEATAATTTATAPLPEGRP